ncbi:MAG: nucleoside recognition domain-containing protein, partial [Mycobacterium leprae]
MAVINAISLWAIPFMLGFIPLWGALRRVKVYDTFIEGAEEGLKVAVQITPFLVGMMVALAVFRASGAMKLLARLLDPVTRPLGFPT